MFSKKIQRCHFDEVANDILQRLRASFPTGLVCREVSRTDFEKLTLDHMVAQNRVVKLDGLYEEVFFENQKTAHPNTLNAWHAIKIPIGGLRSCQNRKRKRPEMEADIKRLVRLCDL